MHGPNIGRYYPAAVGIEASAPEAYVALVDAIAKTGVDRVSETWTKKAAYSRHKRRARVNGERRLDSLPITPQLAELRRSLPANAIDRVDGGRARVRVRSPPDERVGVGDGGPPSDQLGDARDEQQLLRPREAQPSASPWRTTSATHGSTVSAPLPSGGALRGQAGGRRYSAAALREAAVIELPIDPDGFPKPMQAPKKQGELGFDRNVIQMDTRSPRPS